MKDPDFPGHLGRQVLINTGTRFLVLNDFTLSADQFAILCKKRWSVEEYHMSIRQNTSTGSSATCSVKTQNGHLSVSIFAFVKLEKIKLSRNLNHFAVKAKLYMAAVKIAFPEPNALNENLTAA